MSNLTHTHHSLKMTLQNRAEQSYLESADQSFRTRVASREGKRMAFCLMAPVFGAILRKLIPGQPVFVETGFAMLGLTLMLLFGFRKGGGTFRSISMACWIVFSLVYLFLSISYDPKITALGIFTRILPLLLPWIAANCLTKIHDFVFLVRCFTILSLIHIPIIILFLFMGSDALPVIMRPLASYEMLGKGVRAGFGEFVGVMITPSMLANTMLVALFLNLAGLRYEQTKYKKYYYLAIAAELLCMYLSTRRGAMFIGVTGVLVYSILVAKNKLKTIFGLFMAWFIFLMVNDLSRQEGSRDHESRAGHFFTGLDVIFERINFYFVDLTLFWYQQYPLGSFLGSVGREAQAFGMLDEYAPMVESGGPQLMAETGVLGFVLFPLVILTMIFVQTFRPRIWSKHIAVFVLHMFTLLYFIMFFVKEMLCLNTLSVPHLFFFLVFGICHNFLNKPQFHQPTAS